MRSHKLWAQVVNDTGSSAEARKICIEIAADALLYVVGLIEDDEQ